MAAHASLHLRQEIYDVLHKHQKAKQTLLSALSFRSYRLDGVVVGRVDSRVATPLGGRACVNVSNVAWDSWDSTCREGRWPRGSERRARGRRAWEGDGAWRKCGRTRSTGVRVSRGGRDVRGWNAGASVGRVAARRDREGEERIGSVT